jgi:hypothetical protein
VNQWNSHNTQNSNGHVMIWMRYPGPHGPLLLAESRVTSMLQNISIADILQSTITADDKQMLDERPGVHAVVAQLVVA